MKTFGLFCYLSAALWWPHGLSASKPFTTGRAQFHTQQGDSPTTVKKHLIYLATRDIISQELKAMGLDKTLFWSQYQQALQEKLDQAKAALAQAYRVGHAEQTTKQAERYHQVWRKRRLQIEQNLGHLLQVLKSYKAARIARSQRTPMVRSIRIEGQVDQDKLRELYFKFAKSLAPRPIDQLYWSLELSLAQGEWSQLAVANPEELLHPLNELLLKKLQEQLTEAVPTITLANGPEQRKIQNHLKSPPDYLSQERGHLSQALWIQARITMGLSTIGKDFDSLKLESQGDLVVTELRHNQPIYTATLSHQRRRIAPSPKASLASQVGQQIYLQIIPEFIPIKLAIGQLSDNLNRIPLRIIGVKNYLELSSLQDLLTQINSKHQLQLHLDYFSLHETQVILEYIGQKSDWREILTTIHGHALKDGSMLIIDAGYSPVRLTIHASP